MTPLIVYFSSVSGNTHRFVQKLDARSIRLPLHKAEPEVLVEEPYVLIVPTYRSGRGTRYLPPQVVRFLNVKQNRDLIRGVIGAGNRNFNRDYCAGARAVAEKCSTPHLYDFEILGTPEDVETVQQLLNSQEETE